VKRPTILLALVLLVPLSASAKTLLIDGDTIDVDGTRIRIVSIDTPETFRPRCENELILGLKAKERLRALLDAGPVTYKATGKDRYGRTLAVVYAGAMDVGAQLLAEGHALPYVPGPEAKAARLAAWCGSR
jgi:endonuclease YncB( thermonuclease family)